MARTRAATVTGLHHKVEPTPALGYVVHIQQRHGQHQLGTCQCEVAAGDLRDPYRFLHRVYR